MEEIWRDIIITKNEVTYDYSGMYQVSNYGRVRSLDRVDSNGHKVKGKVLKCKPHKNGYVYVGLHKDGKDKKFRIHRLVATAFIPNPNNYPVVNHRDENPSNNVWTNLEWVTQKYNVQYSSHKRKGQKRSEETKQKLSNAKKGDKHPMYGIASDKHPRARKVICLETKQVFRCVKDAQEWLGEGNISHCCRGVSKIAGGYRWMYLDDYKLQLRKQSDINNSKQLAA